jgi:hypothetical protein
LVPPLNVSLFCSLLYYLLLFVAESTIAKPTNATKPTEPSHAAEPTGTGPIWTTGTTIHKPTIYESAAIPDTPIPTVPQIMYKLYNKNEKTIPLLHFLSPFSFSLPLS